MSDIIAFKGYSDGVYLEAKDADFERVVQEVNKTMRKSADFFKGTNFLGVVSEKLTIEETLDIAYMLKYKYDFNLSMDEILENIKCKLEDEEVEIQLVEEIEEIEIVEEDIHELVSEGMTKFVYGTLRSGQMVDYDGNIVIVGDVNPGAHLKAQGNIIVLGTLRGIAHAGLNGDKNSIVAAYKLLPTQLRITDIIVRAPDGEQIEYKVPEVAKIIDGKVIIEPYLPNK